VSRFYYEAVNAQGRLVPGVLDVESHERLMRVLEEKGLTAVSVSLRPPGTSKGARRLGRGSVGAGELAAFTLQMGRLMESGCPMDRALELCGAIAQTQAMASALVELQAGVQQGSSLSEVMAKFPAIFRPLFLASVKAGEAGGFLAKAFAKLAEFERNQDRLRRKIRASMTYPAFMVLALLASLTVIFVFVVPSLLDFFAKSDMVLPAPTRLLIAMSNNSLQILGGTVLLAVFLAICRNRLRATPEGQEIEDRFVLVVPVLGPLVSTVMLARFCRTVALLLEGGVQLTRALGIAREAVTNRFFQKELDLVAEQVAGGESLSRCLDLSPVFPELLVGQVMFGEETGSLAKVLESLAGEYEEHAEGALEGLVGLLEPMMIVTMGVVMGFVVISLFMPLIQMVNAK
jgi:type II secretory pathway component PulF